MTVDNMRSRAFSRGALLRIMGVLVLVDACGSVESSHPVDAPLVSVDSPPDSRSDDPQNCGAPNKVCPDGTCSNGKCTSCSRRLSLAEGPIMFVPHGYDGISGIPGFELDCRNMPAGTLT